MSSIRRLLPLLVLVAGIGVTVAVYLPGLSGAWLIDDDLNLGSFNDYSSGNAPYADLIFGNTSGPLGRPVSMATFAANHALGLFSTSALKATNIALHAANGLLAFLLLLKLFRLRPPLANARPSLLAAVVATWWLVLPMHLSTVLYIVQRMTEVATFFALACCLAYVAGRQQLQAGRRSGWLSLAASPVLLALSVLGKESGICCLAWLVLIELFFLSQPQHNARRHRIVLATLVAGIIVAGTAIVLFPPHFISNGYLLRDFTLPERLLTQPRVLLAYMHNILLPDNATMGLFHDDFTASRGLLSPTATLPAILLIAGLLLAAIYSAGSRRWWLFSFGVLFFLSGHLVESSVISLELYFEHRNYLPSLGLLLAPLPLLELWPWRRSLLTAAIALYLGLLSLSAMQRASIWGDNSLLLSVSALNHPHSLRALSSYIENLANRHPNLALQEAQQAARHNPTFASVLDLQMLTIYCRFNQTPPDALIQQTAANFGQLDKTLAVPIGIGLEFTLSRYKDGHCGSPDFSPLVPALLAQDAYVRQQLGEQRGRLWLLRFNIAEWLVALGEVEPARGILRDVWDHGNRDNMPMVGLILAKTLSTPQLAPERRRVLAELAGVTADAPADFRQEMQVLRFQSGAP